MELIRREGDEDAAWNRYTHMAVPTTLLPHPVLPTNDVDTRIPALDFSIHRSPH